MESEVLSHVLCVHIKVRSKNFGLSYNGFWSKNACKSSIASPYLEKTLPKGLQRIAIDNHFTHLITNHNVDPRQRTVAH